MEREEFVDDKSSYDSDCSDMSSLSDYNPTDKYRRRKGVRSKRSKYQNITNDIRADLIRMVVDEEQKIKPTAKKLGINYSTAKSILQIYRKEGRIDKKILSNSLEGNIQEVARQSSQQAVAEDAQSTELNAQASGGKRRYPLRERKATEEHELIGLPKPIHPEIERKPRKKVQKNAVNSTQQEAPTKLDEENHIPDLGVIKSTSINTQSTETPKIDVKHEEGDILESSNKINPEVMDTKMGRGQPTNIQQTAPSAFTLPQPLLIPQFFNNFPQLSPINMMKIGIPGLYSPGTNFQTSRIVVLAPQQQNEMLLARNQALGNAASAFPAYIVKPFPFAYQMKCNSNN